MISQIEREKLQQLCKPFGEELYRWMSNQLHLLVTDPYLFLELGRKLLDSKYHLVVLFATDERDLDDHCFKLYYIFSHSDLDLYVFVEFALSADNETYPSLAVIFPSVAPFEAEISDMFGLFPEGDNGKVIRGAYLHSCYPSDFFPLRRDRSGQEIQEMLNGFESDTDAPPHEVRRPPDGEVFLPVGPIHAGVIESGHFLFRVGSETVENLEINLGYVHRGVERLFQSFFTLRQGWQLAEQVSGDSSFAHGMAYCHAVESLARISVSPETKLLRCVFLELERIANHIGDSATLVHDLALDMVAVDLAVLRDGILKICGDASGSRFLRGLNRPGGIILPCQLQPSNILETLEKIVPQFLDIARMLVELDDFRERTVNVGILTTETALKLGITGIIARASGIDLDFRIHHPFAMFADAEIQSFISDLSQNRSLYPILYQPLTGDVFSRFLIRVQEAYSSMQLINYLLSKWNPTTRLEFIEPVDFSRIPNFEFGFGYAEGWRGDIVYWIMKDKFEDIFRCKVRDPSTLNWPGLKAAVDPHWVGDQWAETTVVDFPVINKSFNLSYAGNDL